MKERHRRRKAERGERGVALVVVTVAIVIIATLAYESAFNTTVDYLAASHARDNMRAEFHMRSGMNLSRMIIRLQTDVMDRNRKFLGDIQIADYTGMFMSAFGGSREEVDALAEMVGGFSEDNLKGLGVSVGQFDLQIFTDDGKININCANGSAATKENLKAQLESLLFFQAYDPVFSSESADGWRRTRVEQVAAMMDYIDRDSLRTSESRGAEQYDYPSGDTGYKAKNNYIDSLGEAHLIRGVDDRFWTLFGSALTVYGGCKVNIGAMRDPKQIAAVIALSAKNPEDPVVQDPAKLWRLAQRVSESAGFGYTFADLKEFAEYVNNPDGQLQALAGEQSAQGIQSTVDPTTLGPAVDGVELDPAKLAQIAAAGPRRTYRVEVTAVVGDLQRRVIGIWDTQTQNQNMRTQDYARGSWVYWREE